jgi:hypothetical protein
MGQSLGEVFHELSLELTLLCWHFQEVRELYGEHGARLELMNHTAPFFFWMLQRTWWDEALLGLTRLLAPEASMGKPNLTFQRLSALIPDPALKAKIADAVSALTKKAAFAMQWRNKRIAHRDLDHSLKRTVTALPPVSLQDVSSVLEDMADVLNSIELHFTHESTSYVRSPISHGVMAMLSVLRDGVRLEEKRQSRLEKGEYDPADWDDGNPPL